MQPIYIDLHIHTSENANNLNTNYDIAELVGQIKKLNGDSPFMISLTCLLYTSPSPRDS